MGRAQNEALDRLLQNYDKEAAASKTDYVVAMATLKLKYLDALQQGVARATKAGNLDASVQFKKEFDHMGTAIQVPDDDAGLVAELLKMRASFRGEAKKAAAARTATTQDARSCQPRAARGPGRQVAVCARPDPTRSPTIERGTRREAMPNVRDRQVTRQLPPQRIGGRRSTRRVQGVLH